MPIFKQFGGIIHVDQGKIKRTWNIIKKSNRKTERSNS